VIAAAPFPGDDDDNDDEVAAFGAGDGIDESERELAEDDAVMFATARIAPSLLPAHMAARAPGAGQRVTMRRRERHPALKKPYRRELARTRSRMRTTAHGSERCIGRFPRRGLVSLVLSLAAARQLSWRNIMAKVVEGPEGAARAIRRRRSANALVAPG